jgi:O-acetyl-ADP-ribose deacetylase (regulator of RNase III)
VNQILRQKTFPSGAQFQIVQGDITLEVVDAIVNAANRHLQHGGGVAGVIVRRGGPVIQLESDAWVQKHGPINPAAPAYTFAGHLPCKYVIHAVGPIWGEGDEDAKLSTAVSASLQLAGELNLVSVSMPAISTGIFGFPMERAAKIIFKTVEDFLGDKPQTRLTQVRLVLYDQAAVDLFLRIWDTGNLESNERAAS